MQDRNSVKIVLTVMSLAACILLFSFIQFPAFGQNDARVTKTSMFDFSSLFEYTFEVSGTEIFPNNTIKDQIIIKQKAANYSVASLDYSILGYQINASDVMIHAVPQRIDQDRTRVDLPLIFAEDVRVDNGSIKRSFETVDIRSVYGIYDINADKMTIHIPYSSTLPFLS